MVGICLLDVIIIICSCYWLLLVFVFCKLIVMLNYNREIVKVGGYRLFEEKK